MENRDFNQQENMNQEMNPGGQHVDRQGSGKNRFWSGVLAGALVTAFVGLIVVGMSAGIYLFGMRVMRSQPRFQPEDGAVSITDGREQSQGGLDYDKVTAKMTLIENIVGQTFLYDEDAEAVEDYIYRGMMAGLSDPYSVYYSATDYKSMMDTTQGEYSGIGAMISQNRTTGLCTIVKVFEGSPALEAGMQPGDVIYKVEDTLVAGESLEVLVNNFIKGKEGTPVNITVYRSDKDEYAELTMNRRKIEVPTVEHRMLEDSIGYIAVSEFDAITVKQFQEAVDELSNGGMKGLIIDLRNNPGGLLDGAVKMVDYLLPDNITRYDKGDGKTLIVYTADKNEKGDVFTASDKHQVDLPMVILINGDSASASEVFTGAMKDYNRATVVGTTSYGKGIVQNLIPLGDGSAIKLTTAHYYTPSGFDLHGKGIEPDVEVDLSEELKTQAVVKPEEDNQIRKAVEVMNGKIK
ncbi:MAG: S41 family peptidase [Clostridium sp.]|nr:S41 family peptidase [Clostridium sp.]